MAPASESVPDESDSDSASKIVARADGVSMVYTRGNDPGRIGRTLGRTAAPRVTALADVSLDIAAGEITGLAGPSGSGKSTLLHLLAGLELPTGGQVVLAGQDPAALSSRQRTRLRLETVGVVFQQFHLLESLSARANVALPLIELGESRRERRRRATALLERVGLGDRVKHRPGELSGGEQQRVAIARALVTDPDVVIADEPTGELDTETGQSVLNEFERVAENRAVVVASHDQATLDIADRVIRLQDGKIAREESTSQ